MSRTHAVDSCHDEADLGGVSSASEMGIDLLGLVLIQADEAVQNIIASQGVVLTTLVVWGSNSSLD